MVNNIIDLKNKPHAILLVESKLCNLEDFIKKYISSIIDSNKGNNAQLNGTVPYNNYFDIIKINDYEANIKKESIINLINEFSKSSVEEKGFKFYVIYGIEYATAQAINSLLKFLEEPPQNTYAILTTRALNLVLPTVRSRCHVYILKSDFNTFATKIAEFHLSKEQTKIIEQVYFNYDEIINDLKNNLFQNIYELVTS
jgi:DNA polymerase-3 subunit delta'